MRDQQLNGVGPVGLYGHHVSRSGPVGQAFPGRLVAADLIPCFGTGLARPLQTGRMEFPRE